MYDDDHASGGDDDDHGGHGTDYVMQMMTFVVINIRQLVLMLFIRYMMAKTIVLTMMTVKFLGAKMLGFLIMIMCLIPCIMMTILVVMIMMTVTMIWVAEISFFSDAPFNKFRFHGARVSDFRSCGVGFYP